jgi:MFS family permease
MKKNSADNHTKTLRASRNTLFLLFALPGIAFATWISRTAATRDTLAVSNVAAVSIIGYTAFLVGPPFLGILGETFGIRNALLAVLLFVLLSGIVSSVTRENTAS